VGDCAETEIVHRLIVKHGLRGYVIPLGRVPEKYLRRLLSAAKVNIMTSVKEGFGRTVIEAAAFDTVSVGYKVRGLDEALRILGGIEVPRDNVVELAKRIIDVLNNYEKLRDRVKLRFRLYQSLTEKIFEKFVEALTQYLHILSSADT